MRTPTVFPFTNPSGNTVWKADVQVGVKPNGSPRFSRVTGKTKKEATERAHKAFLAAQRGELALEGREHFRSFSMRWLEQVKTPTVREATAADYRYKLEHYIYPVFGSRALRDISTSQVTAFLSSLRNRGMANYSISGIRQVLGAVMKYATVLGHVSKNPVTHAPVYKKSRRHTVNVKAPWTKEEAQQVLEAIRGQPIELFGMLTIFLGLRKSEALGLKWSDFDLENARFTINRSIREISIYRADGSRQAQMVEGEPKTETSRRTLVLTRPVLESLLRHREQVDHRGLLSSDSWVFTTRFGTPQRPGTIASQLNRVLENHKIRRIRIHDIRHTALVLALESGTAMEAVSQGAGHSRLDTTKSIYAPYCQTLADTFSNNLTNYLTSDEIDEQLESLLHEESNLASRGQRWGWGKR